MLEIPARTAPESDKTASADVGPIAEINSQVHE